MYSKEVKEYCWVRIEQGVKNVALAKEIREKFGLQKSLDALRMFVNSQRDVQKMRKNAKPIKRLFFDIETSYLKGWFWRTGKQYMGPENIQSEKKVICISYKWQYENQVHSLTWDKNQDERSMLKKFISVLGDADEIIGHNGDRFDIKELRTRCISNGVLMFPTYRTLDTLKKARQYFNFASNKLDYIGQFLDVGKKLDHEGIGMWLKVVENNDRKTLEKMVQYCEQDVLLLEDVYCTLAPFIWHNTNFAVLTGGEKWECPECAGKSVKMYKTYTTAMGVVRRNMKCNDCKKQYRISNRTYLSMLEHLGNKK